MAKYVPKRFSHEKSKDEMHFDKCDVELEEILPLI